MIQNNLLLDVAAITYPESDGLPMADNTRQLRWIVVLFGNLSAQYRSDQVFVTSNVFWYPVEGHPEDRIAPDVFVVFGRPKGERSSYMQWNEDHVPVTVAFEVLSPGNTVIEMANKLFFYDQYGVKEYYVFDPDSNNLLVYLRRGGNTLLREWVKESFVSPLLGVRFDLTGPEMVVYAPDGRPFLSFEELEAERRQEREQRLAAEQQADQARQQAEQARQQAEQARQQAEQARQQAEQARQQAEQARQQADQARQRADQAEKRLARLTELGRKARRNLASVDELAELERLEEELPP
jgi:Uma2 family endonuclease